MSEDLPVQDYSWWHTLVAHSKWVWFVILAVVVDFIADVLHEGAVLALCVRRVTLLALLALLDNPVVKALMLEHSFVGIDAVRALSTGWVLAKVFKSGCLSVLLRNSKTVYALLVGTVPALGLLVLLVSHGLLGASCWLRSLRGVNHLFIFCASLSFFFRHSLSLSLGRLFDRLKLDILVSDV